MANKTSGNTGYGGLIKSGGKGSIVISFPAIGDDRDIERTYQDMWNQLVAKEMYITREAVDTWGSQPSIYWFLAGSFEQAARWCCVWTGHEDSPVQDWFFPWIRNVWSERHQDGQWESLLYVCKTQTLGYGQTLELAYLQRFGIPFRGACFKQYTERELNSTDKWLHETQIWKRTRNTAKGKTVVCLHPRVPDEKPCPRRVTPEAWPHEVDDRERCDPTKWARANDELDMYHTAAEVACRQIPDTEKKTECDRLSSSFYRKWKGEVQDLRETKLDQTAISQLATLLREKRI
jgi:hypothetical protein